jgi:hypothetical protein
VVVAVSLGAKGQGLATGVREPLTQPLVDVTSETVPYQHIEGQGHDDIDDGDHGRGDESHPGGVAEAGPPVQPGHVATIR